MKTQITKTITVVAVAILTLFGAASCKKDKVNTQLPSNYTNQGTITVKNKSIKIGIFDNSEEDGDILNLFFNGNKILSNYEILNEPNIKYLNITLENGNNWIGIEPISEGSVGSCSATVTIDDGNSVQSIDIDGYINNPGGYIIKL